MMVNPYNFPITTTKIRFDVDKLIADYQYANTLWPATEDWNRTLLNLKKPENLNDYDGMRYGTDHLDGNWFYDKVTNKFKVRQEDFTEYCDWVKSTYTHKVCVQVNEWIERKFQMKTGRNRFVTLKPNTCLPLHTDPDSELRFHIPVITNDKCFFVIDNRVCTMPEPGRLYLLNVNRPHTVINASDVDRTHIILDGYSNNLNW